MIGLFKDTVMDSGHFRVASMILVDDLKVKTRELIEASSFEY